MYEYTNGVHVIMRNQSEVAATLPALFGRNVTLTPVPLTSKPLSEAGNQRVPFFDSLGCPFGRR